MTGPAPEAGRRPPDPVAVPGQFPQVTMEIVERLAQARAYHLVGQALAEICPNDEDWDRVTYDPNFLALVAETADALVQIQVQAPPLPDNATPEQVQDAAAQHYGTLVDAAASLAAYLAVDPEDLVSFLVA